ncbi:MAG: cysteine synthase family protein [Bacillota bacterium]|nr:cysteine synthase family protein [Bacillota bacterium]
MHEEITKNSVLDTIGNTPLFQLKQVTNTLNGVQVYVKAEYFNPSGSVKDRAAYAMVLDGIRSGQLTKEKIIIDATSGNTGIAYAMIGAILGYKVVLCLPKNTSNIRKLLLKSYGAQLIETSPLESSDGAQLKAIELVKENPDKYFYPDQYNNDANWKAHVNGTAKEIWEQTNKKVTHFVAGMGTSGTFVGTSRGLKQYNPNIKTIAMQPDSPLHGLEGMKHMQSTITPGIYDSSIADDTVYVTTEDAEAMVLRLAKEEGLFVGISSGANVVAALNLAKTLPEGSKVVTILCDNGYRYVNDTVWKDGEAL